jgi:hypothetical protein
MNENAYKSVQYGFNARKLTYFSTVRKYDGKSSKSVPDTCMTRGSWRKLSIT